MTEKNPFAEIEAAVAEILDAPDMDLLSLARLARLDPGSDFRHADLRQIDLCGEDLTAFDFRGADLRQANLRGATIYRSALEGALLERATLEGLRYLEEDSLPLWGGPEGWSTLGPSDAPAELIEALSPIDGRYRISDRTTQLRMKRLPWYGDAAFLLALNDRSAWPKRLVIYYLLDANDQLYRLNGTSSPVHEVNATAPIELSDDNVLDYLRFFCFFVRGEEGPFYVAETMDDPLLPQNLDEQTRALLEGAVRPALLEGHNEFGHFLADAVLFYSNALFIANFAVDATGMCEMLNDEPIAGDLAVRVDAPIA